MRLLHQASEPDTGIGSSSLVDHAMLDDVTWLDANWMFLSLFGGILVFIWLFSSHWPGSLRDKLFNPVWLAYFSASVYSIHQFEEHGYDIFGRRYMFVPVFNASLGTKFGLQLLPRTVTWINILAIWVIFPFWGRMATKENGFYPATLPWGMAVVNGLTGHLLPFFTNVGELRYVPGAVQSLFMVPFGLWILIVVFKKDGLMLGTVLPLVIGVLFHVVGLQFPMFFLLSLPEGIRITFFMGLCTLLPLMLANNSAFQGMISKHEIKRQN